MRTGLLVWPGSAQYRQAATPHNRTVVQRPAAVARPMTAEEVGEAVRWAGGRQLSVAVQASGHGAGAPVDDHHLLVDTSGLSRVFIDSDARTAHVGSGSSWAEVNSAAEQRGLFGLAGSSPSVTVAGYTFGGGVGWLTRPYGMASSALLAVDYVDGRGEVRRATDDAPDPIDRAALWTFRGGGGVGIATALTFELVAPQSLWAGYQLWDAAALRPVTEAWAGAMEEIGDALSTSISVLRTPPDSPFPAQLQGVPVVHLAFAAARGRQAAVPLLRALRDARPPVVDDRWGPADAARLAAIHLDPPDPVPALGIGRWLGPRTPELARDVLTAAAAESDIAMVELRNVDNTAPARHGAMTAVPGPFLLHAIGVAADPQARARTERALAAIREITASGDVGLAAASFADGRAGVEHALNSTALQQLARVCSVIDPEGRFAPSRIVRGTEAV